MQYDYLIVGSGFFGAVFARQMTDKGFKCLVVEQRSHIGGNSYTYVEDDIVVHQYGPHIFHTNSPKIWRFISRYAIFNHYVHQVRVRNQSSLYSFPINLFTLHQIWGVTSPPEAQSKLQSVLIPCANPQNLEEWILSKVGEELYQKFIYGYTKKQWGRNPKDLPASIIQRLPIRLTMNDVYFNDRFQGIPIGGYTPIFESLLKGIPVELNVDYLNDRDALDAQANKIVYTGALDAFFNYDLGALSWRGLRFEHSKLAQPDYQGASVINYADENVPWTRIIEHKHFDFGNQNTTIITKEFPQAYAAGEDRFYPVNDDANSELHRKYSNRVDASRYLIGGRLGNYQYYDMHQVIGEALALSEKELTSHDSR